MNKSIFRNPCRVSFVGCLVGAMGDCYPITETVEYNHNEDLMKLDLYEGRTINSLQYQDITDFKVLDRIYTVDDLTRINNDVNGNPRYVIHFLALLTDQERGDLESRYNVAIARAKKMFGGKKFHNRQYGGGIVFTSYNVDTELRLINEFHCSGGVL